MFTPHTWGNGIGLLANAHLTAGTVGAPFLEFPFDPPEWTTARRDFPLVGTVEVDGDGWLHLGDRPGLGLELDEDVLARTATSRRHVQLTSRSRSAVGVAQQPGDVGADRRRLDLGVADEAIEVATERADVIA